MWLPCLSFVVRFEFPSLVVRLAFPYTIFKSLGNIVVDFDFDASGVDNPNAKPGVSAMRMGFAIIAECSWTCSHVDLCHKCSGG